MTLTWGASVQRLSVNFNGQRQLSSRARTDRAKALSEQIVRILTTFIPCKGKECDAPPLQVSVPIPSSGHGINLCLPASARSVPAQTSSTSSGLWSMFAPVRPPAPATITTHPQGKEWAAAPPLHVSVPLPSIGQVLNLCLPNSARSPARSPANASSGLAGQWSVFSPVKAPAPATITAHPQVSNNPHLVNSLKHCH
ncbi:jg21419 [Pararge aegeria aegeria]|uniref:Jg21419 protein n=1 Tax=Pararge aegeria aegeria TaxID=348720 RepID=A0A8S4R0R5_9NEOP|nr:jg21419 [Pararge aegeria aegeria]